MVLWWRHKKLLNVKGKVPSCVIYEESNLAYSLNILYNKFWFIEKKNVYTVYYLFIKWNVMSPVSLLLFFLSDSLFYTYFKWKCCLWRFNRIKCSFVDNNQRMAIPFLKKKVQIKIHLVYLLIFLSDEKEKENSIK